MRKDHPPLEKHLGQVAQTQLVAHPLQDHQRDDIGRILEAIIGCSCALIETTLASPAAKAAVAQCSTVRTFDGGGRLTVWIRHHSSSFRRHESTPFTRSSQGDVKFDRTGSGASVENSRHLSASCHDGWRGLRAASHSESPSSRQTATAGHGIAFAHPAECARFVQTVQASTARHTATPVRDRGHGSCGWKGGFHV